MAEAKPNVLILGGCGYVGRSLAMHIIDNELASKVVIADKLNPILIKFNSRESDLIAKAEFRSGNLATQTAIDKCFEGEWPIVVNCAAETRYGQSEAVYMERIKLLGVMCATAAVKHGCKRFVQVSTARIYKSNKSPSTETDPVDAHSAMFKAFIELESELAKIEGLNYVIVRPGDIYGPGISMSSPLTPRIVISAIYKNLGETMQLLWSKDLSMNTVHIRDMCRALWLLTNTGTSGAVYNIVDKGETTQGKICEVLSKIFDIKYSFIGSLVTHAVGVEEAVDYSNDKHLSPWAKLCLDAGIQNTELSPFLDEDLLTDHELRINGTKIESLGFEYEIPEFNVDLVREIIDDLINKRLFPANIPAMKK